MSIKQQARTQAVTSILVAALESKALVVTYNSAEEFATKIGLAFQTLYTAIEEREDT